MIAFAFIEFYLNREKVLKWLRNKYRKNNKFLEIVRIIDNTLTLKIDNGINTIFIPLILTLLIEAPIIIIYIVLNITKIPIFLGNIIGYLLFNCIAPIVE